MTERTFNLAVDFARGDDRDDAAFGDFLDAFFVELGALGVADRVVVSDAAARTWSVSLVVQAAAGDNEESVLGCGLTAIRTALGNCRDAREAFAIPRPTHMSLAVA